LEMRVELGATAAINEKERLAEIREGGSVQPSLGNRRPTP